MKRASRALALLLVLAALPAGAASVQVGAGALDHFRVTVPATTLAGEAFSVRLEAVDAFDNLVADYAATGRGALVTVVGRGMPTPVNIEPGQFSGGIATLEVTYPIAEAVVVKVAERGGRARGESGGLTIRPGPADHFTTAVPVLARAGEPFTMTITAYDRFNNLVTDYAARAHGVALTTSGLGKLTPALVAGGMFINGVATVQVSYDMAEALVITVRDQERPAGAQSAAVQVRAGALAKFVVMAPRAGTAGAPFRIALEAKDSYGNTVTDYATLGSGVELSGNGAGRLAPLFVNPDQFRQGVAFVTMSYTGMDNFIISARERNLRAVTGASEALVFTAGALGAFTVEAPAAAVAGEPFTVKITVADAFGNVIRDFSRSGQIVRLRHGGTVPEAEQVLAAGRFIDGVAAVSVTYRVAEPLTFVARQERGGIAGTSRPVAIAAAAPDHIRVATPARAVAGQPFTVTLTAEDVFNNRVTDYAARGAEVRVAVAGTAVRPLESVPPARFGDGQAQVLMTYTKAEDIVVRAENRDGGMLGVSAPLTVAGGPLAAFRVLAPAEVAAGEEFLVKLLAVDAFENTITDYEHQGGGVKLAANGVGALLPATVAPAQFHAGVATVGCRYQASEIISVVASEERGVVTGTSAPVRVNPGALDHFVLTTPATVTAGQVFPLRLEAQDRYYNTIRDYAARGAMVTLRADGGGELAPTAVSAAEFAAGVATTNVSVTQAGELRLLAGAGAAQGLSQALTCLPGAVVKFRVETPGGLRAGEPFAIRIVPEDAYGNRVTAYTQQQELLQLVASGSGKLLPATVHPAAFVDGLAALQAIYTRAEAVEISVRPAGPAGEAARTLDDIIVTGGGADRVVVRLVGNAPLECRDARLAELRLLVADLPGVTLAGEAHRQEFAEGPLASVQLTQEAGAPAPLVRVTIALRDPVDYTVTAEQNIVTLTFARLPEAAGIPAPAGLSSGRPGEGIVYLGGAAVVAPGPGAPLPVISRPLTPVVDGTRSADYHLSKAEGFIRLEKYQEALGATEEALALEPRNARALELQRRLRRLVLLFQPTPAGR